jgi:hypothetical protein
LEQRSRKKDKFGIGNKFAWKRESGEGGRTWKTQWRICGRLELSISRRRMSLETGNVGRAWKREVMRRAILE